MILSFHFFQFPARSLIKRSIYRYIYSPPPNNPPVPPPVSPTSPPLSPSHDKKDDPEKKTSIKCAVSQPRLSSATRLTSQKPAENHQSSYMTSTTMVIKPHPPHK